MQLVAYGLLLLVVVVGIVLPTLFIPRARVRQCAGADARRARRRRASLTPRAWRARGPGAVVLTGLVDTSVPSVTVLTVWSTLVLSLGVLIVVLNLIRLRGRITAVVGGLLVIAAEVYFVISTGFIREDSAYSLRKLQVRVGDLTLIALATLVWKGACRTLNPGVHMLHYLTTSIMLSSLACRLVDTIERVRPLELVLSRLREEETTDWPRIARLCDAFVASVWWFFGLSFARIRFGLSVASVAIVAFRYALSDRAHHVPSSPLRMALILRGVLVSIVELIPVGPILFLRTAGRLLFGRPLVETLHALGLVGLLHRPRTFFAAARLRAECARACSYTEWLSAKAALDDLEGREAWRVAKSPHFDWRLVERARETLARVRAEADAMHSPHALAELLMTLVNRKFANINDPHNYMYPGVGCKASIERLLAEITGAIEHLVRSEWPLDSGWTKPRKAAFVAAARHAHGCTALCLSGGGAIAMYHMGLVKELLAHGLLPAVVSGTSGGAIVAGLLACRTDEELPAFITEDVSTRDGHRWFDDAWTCIRRFATDGVVVNKEAFLAALEPICGDLTFAEAFARTGRLVNLSTSTTSLGATLLLNHIVTPNVLVRSAVQASCALTGVMRPGTLLAKAPDGSIVPLESAGLLFRDGSFQSDIPMRELSAQFHATHFIVSQVNVHVAPFLFERAQPCSYLSRLQRFIVTDVRARLDKYAKAHDYLPTELQNLVAQEYVGRPEDVTIFPRLRLSDLTCARTARHAAPRRRAPPHGAPRHRRAKGGGRARAATPGRTSRARGDAAPGGAGRGAPRPSGPAAARAQPRRALSAARPRTQGASCGTRPRRTCAPSWTGAPGWRGRTCCGCSARRSSSARCSRARSRLGWRCTRRGSRGPRRASGRAARPTTACTCRRRSAKRPSPTAMRTW